MLELALWLKKNGFRADQVQAFLPSPMATATAMYHSGKNPLKRVSRASEEVVIPKGIRCAACTRPFSDTTTRRTGRVTRGVEAHGPGGLDRQRQASFDSGLPAGGAMRQPADSESAAGRGDSHSSRPALPFRTQHTGLPRSGLAGRRRHSCQYQTTRTSVGDGRRSAPSGARLGISPCCARAVRLKFRPAVSSRNSST